MPLKDTIFRQYGIRGRAHVDGELTPDNVTRIVNALLASKPTQGALIIGADHRSSSNEFRSIAVATAAAAGRKVVDIGTLTTPMLYFAQFYLHIPVGIMLTASHDPDDWNGFILADGFLSTLVDAGIRDIRDLAAAGARPELRGDGDIRQVDLAEDYIHAIACRVTCGERRFKVIVDCGNGTAGLVAPALFERMGVDVVPLFCDPDWRFPNHSPDPSNPGTRAAARAAVLAHGADLALLFDGDGDRLGVIDDRGEDVTTDQLLAFFSLRLLAEGQAPTVVSDVRFPQVLEALLAERGGRSILCEAGYPHLKRKSMEAPADLAGERRGHICIFENRWFGFDDALFAAGYLLECLSRGEASLSERLRQQAVR